MSQEPENAVMELASTPTMSPEVGLKELKKIPGSQSWAGNRVVNGVASAPSSRIKIASCASILGDAASLARARRMQSPVAVALSPRVGRNLAFGQTGGTRPQPSRIFRTGSVSWGMPCPLETRARRHRSEPSPTGCLIPPQPGRQRPE
jgi:hypothetical protein